MELPSLQLKCRPENECLEDEISFQMAHFQVRTVSFREDTSSFGMASDLFGDKKVTFNLVERFCFGFRFVKKRSENRSWEPNGCQALKQRLSKEKFRKSKFPNWRDSERFQGKNTHWTGMEIFITCHFSRFPGLRVWCFFFLVVGKKL